MCACPISVSRVCTHTFAMRTTPGSSRMLRASTRSSARAHVSNVWLSPTATGSTLRQRRCSTIKPESRPGCQSRDAGAGNTAHLPLPHGEGCRRVAREGSGSLEQDDSLDIVAMEEEEQARLMHNHRLGKGQCHAHKTGQTLP